MDKHLAEQLKWQFLQIYQFHWEDSPTKSTIHSRISNEELDQVNQPKLKGFPIPPFEKRCCWKSQEKSTKKVGVYIIYMYIVIYLYNQKCFFKTI